ncbi:hypothetical protein MSHOH_2096 [Methanosarcina horonobensis HB-1 = JCM 15518]|uniref:Uncharacterized protein n=1 Tax=Methanosarcina horonobensis HB-1 = JCM 15518 TaxID=1434110 RepID=A0A0E3SA79_9EURY|nr:hypothetical protein MSHOH_2096 [Methanosarcina horonobensis HB-1 = JCM 15518]
MRYLVAQTEHLSGGLPAADHCIKGNPFYFLSRIFLNYIILFLRITNFFDLLLVLKLYYPDTFFGNLKFILSAKTYNCSLTAVHRIKDVL